jgi:putative colanic acid biosynthesis acetyltransferase WcaF
MKRLRIPLERQPPPTLANKAARALWGVGYIVLYRFSPRPLHGWRRIVLRLFGAKIGKGVLPYPTANIWAPWNLEMGDRSVIGDGVDCYSVDRVVFGKHAVASQRSFLCTASREIHDPDFPLMTAPITLEAEAWVAAEAYIGPGVSLREGAVAAARAVVLEDVLPWMIAGGSPAKVIGTRRRSGG